MFSQNLDESHDRNGSPTTQSVLLGPSSRKSFQNYASTRLQKKVEFWRG